MPPALISCEQALATVTAQMGTLAPPAATESLPLAAALGRVLVQTITADRDQPPFPRSTRDGFAVHAETFANAPAKVVGSIRAGEAWTGPTLQPGEAIEIMTGAPAPQGADAIVMQEHVTITEATVALQPKRSVRSGENIVPRAAEAKHGDTLLIAGARVTPATIALAASVGATSLTVYTQPTVAILSTGDELVDIADTPGPTHIRNSNAHALAAMVTAEGGIARILPIAADTREALHAAITSADDADMLLLSGGVSAGKYDLVEDVLLALGAEFLFTSVALQPGKPVVFGKRSVRGKTQWLLGLPGNPVSTHVTGLLFAMPVLRALAGERADQCVPRFALAVLGKQVKVRAGLTRFQPARLAPSLTQTAVTPTGSAGAGDLNSNAQANCYLVVPPDRDGMEAGETVTVLLR